MADADLICDFCSDRPVVAIHGTRVEITRWADAGSPYGWAACAHCHGLILAGDALAVRLYSQANIARKYGVAPDSLGAWIKQAHSRFWRTYEGWWEPWPNGTKRAPSRAAT